MWARMERELAIAGHDLTFSQYITIKKLANGTAGVTDLARAAELNPGAMTRLLDRLEATRPGAARAPIPADRRALHILLTDAGLAIWRDINQCGQRVRERAMAGMERGRARTADRACSNRCPRQPHPTRTPDPCPHIPLPRRAAACRRFRAAAALLLAGCASTDGLAPAGARWTIDGLVRHAAAWTRTS